MSEYNGPDSKKPLAGEFSEWVSIETGQWDIPTARVAPGDFITTVMTASPINTTTWTDQVVGEVTAPRNISAIWSTDEDGGHRLEEVSIVNDPASPAEEYNGPDSKHPWKNSIGFRDHDIALIGDGDVLTCNGCEKESCAGCELL